MLDLRVPPIGAAEEGPRTAARWGALPLCGQGKRHTCLVDGDTGWAGGTKWRLVNIDAPEISRPECPRERTIGRQATRRLQALLAAGYDLDGDGHDRYGRELVTITLSDGRDAGAVLMAEGLAQPWPNRGNVWCGR
nr:thermonuclease family protein [Jiella avicenniae]